MTAPRASEWRDHRAIDVHVHLASGVPIARILEQSAARGIDAVVVSPWMADVRSALEEGKSAEHCRRENGALGEAVAAFPGVVQALGALPLDDCDAAVRMLAGLRGEGLLGAAILPSAAGRWLGDPFFEPLWEAADDLGALVFVHPGTHGLGMEVLNEGFLWNAVGNPVETAIGAAHLLAAGVLERHTGLQVLLAHGGGALPALIGRLEHAWRRRRIGPGLVEGPEASFRRFLFDTVVHSPLALSGLVAAVGAERVLLGSDLPFEMGSDDPLADLKAIGLDTPAERRIACGNAAALASGGGGA